MKSKKEGKYDINVSPVGWYLGTYVLRFIELADTNNDDLNTKFPIWENTVIVKATDLDHAFDRIEAIAMEQSHPYKGGPDGVHVKFVYEGIRSLLPIYENVGDGCEIAWSESTRLLRCVRSEIGEKGSFHQ